MPLTTITRKLEWDAGHRVLGHEGKCAALHGHRYSAELTVTAPDLDGLGRVIDFSVLKSVVGGWVDDNWDHNFLCHPNDPLLKVQMVMMRENDNNSPTGKREVLTDVIGRSPYVMKTGNPTAENIACELFNKATELLASTGITVVRVTVHETPNCAATYQPVQ